MLNSIGVPPAARTPVFDVLGERPQVEVARHRLGPGVGDPDRRPRRARRRRTRPPSCRRARGRGRGRRRRSPSGDAGGRSRWCCRRGSWRNLLSRATAARASSADSAALGVGARPSREVEDVDRAVALADFRRGRRRPRARRAGGPRRPPAAARRRGRGRRRARRSGCSRSRGRPRRSGARRGSRPVRRRRRRGRPGLAEWPPVTTTASGPSSLHRAGEVFLGGVLAEPGEDPRLGDVRGRDRDQRQQLVDQRVAARRRRAAGRRDSATITGSSTTGASPT